MLIVDPFSARIVCPLLLSDLLLGRKVLHGVLELAQVPKL